MTPYANAAAPGGQPVIQVRLAHACAIVSAGLRAILATQPDLRVSAGPYGTALPPGPCVVVADYEASVAAARQRWHGMRGQAVQLPVLALTHRAKAGAVRHAIENGVRGYVIQGGDAGEVLEGVRRLSRGGYYLSPVAGRLEAEWLRRKPLTQREADVLQALVQGGTDKAIARGLGIGVGTVKAHMKQLFNKLDVETRTQAALAAMELGLFESNPGERECLN